jgi:DNA repair protein RecO (recombination protein O)
MSRRPAAAPLAAYLLHRYDWSESSLILELFTRERGRVAAAAKGARRPYSQFRSVLLPFQRLTVTLGQAPGDDSADLHTLRGAEWAGGAPGVAGAALFRGFYLNELLLRLLARQDPHPALFDAYAQTLPAMAGPGDGAAALRAFELVLLRETGVLPELSVVTQTHVPVRADARYTLAADGGVTDAPGDAAVPGRTLLALQRSLADADLAAVRAACADAPGPLRLSLRAVLQYHLGHHLLRTRQVMQEVQRLSPPERETR